MIQEVEAVQGAVIPPPFIHVEDRNHNDAFIYFNNAGVSHEDIERATKKGSGIFKYEVLEVAFWILAMTPVLFNCFVFIRGFIEKRNIDEALSGDYAAYYGFMAGTPIALALMFLFRRAGKRAKAKHQDATVGAIKTLEDNGSITKLATREGSDRFVWDNYEQRLDACFESMTAYQKILQNPSDKNGSIELMEAINGIMRLHETHPPSGLLHDYYSMQSSFAKGSVEYRLGELYLNNQNARRKAEKNALKRLEKAESKEEALRDSVGLKMLSNKANHLEHNLEQSRDVERINL